MTSCQATKVEDVTPIVTFPIFPNPKPYVTFDEDTNLVSMPLPYWLDITNYVIDVRKVEKIIEGM